MKIPILMYHAIGKNSSNLSISLENFDKQMRYMKKQNYNTISFDKINFNKDKNKHFIITFDDGYENVYYNALPILKKYNFVATCFFVTEYTGSYNVWDERKKNFIKQKLMNIDQIKDWVNSGMLAGSHTLTHPNLKNIPYDNKIKEITESRSYLNKLLSINIDSFSYPFGSYDIESIEIVKKFYKFAVTTNRSRYIKNKFSNNLIPRIPINNNNNLFKFYLKTQTIYEDIKFKQNN